MKIQKNDETSNDQAKIGAEPQEGGPVVQGHDLECQIQVKTARSSHFQHLG